MQPLMLREEVLGAPHTPPPPHTSSLNNLISSPPVAGRSIVQRGGLVCHQTRRDQPWRLVRSFVSRTAPGMTRALCKSTLGLVIPRQKLTLLSCACCTKRLGKKQWSPAANKLSVPGTMVQAVRPANCARRVVCTQQKTCTVVAQVSVLVMPETFFKVSGGAGGSCKSPPASPLPPARGGRAP